MATTTPELEAIKLALFDGLRVPLTPEQGVEAFARHQLLAIRFHRAARLNQRSSDREAQGWCRFFREHFPRGDAQAPLLWGQWRVPLLKDETPGAGIVITHRAGVVPLADDEPRALHRSRVDVGRLRPVG